MSDAEKGVAIVTGGSRGIGAATCKMLAEDGWDVAVNYASNEAAAEHVVGEVTAAGRRAIAVQGDMAVEADILRLFMETEQKLGPVRGLVNNAGITSRATRVEDMTAESVAAVMNLNVVGLILCCREATRRMSTKFGGNGGVIVNVSSIAARLGSANTYAHYAASKAAVNSFTLGFAHEVIAEGVRANVVAPGMTETDIHESSGIADRVEKIGPSIPFGRCAYPDEIAEAIVWMMSEKANYCVGSVLEVGGGR